MICKRKIVIFDLRFSIKVMRHAYKLIYTLVEHLVVCAWISWVSGARKSCDMDTSWDISCHTKKNKIFVQKVLPKSIVFCLKKSSNCRKYVYYFRHSFHKFFFHMRMNLLSFWSKKVMWYGHLLRSVQVKNGKKKFD